MFTRTQIESKLDDEIVALLAKLETLRDKPEEYDAVVERISQLDKLKTRKGISPPSMDTVLIAAANIFGVIWVARYEKSHPIPKAMSQVMKAK